MKLNKKGISLVEIIVSISLISIVLIFLMNLFITTRDTYNQSKIQSDFAILNSIIIKAIGNDISSYGLKSVEYIDSSSSVSFADKSKNNAVVLTFNEYRPDNLSQNIKKVLKVYYNNSRYYISYAYDEAITNNITTSERLTNIIREVPEDVAFNTDNFIFLINNGASTNGGDLNNLSPNTVIEIKIPMSTGKGNIYDINMFGIIE